MMEPAPIVNKDSKQILEIKGRPQAKQQTMLDNRRRSTSKHADVTMQHKSQKTKIAVIIGK